MEDKNQRRQPEQDCGQDIYQTGSTTPPKSYGGIIAVLLVAVIFLTGVSTALGLLNIRLFKQISAQNGQELSPVAFSQVQTGDDAPAQAGTVTEFPALGITGQALSSFYQVYYHLPQGIYITDVAPGSDAYAKGILPGDVLVSVDAQPVSTEAALSQQLARHAAGDKVSIVIYREDRSKKLEVELG